jgi:endonuclease/exonuclease/phosphatase family metal-dependent hydrolase
LLGEITHWAAIRTRQLLISIYSGRPLRHPLASVLALLLMTPLLGSCASPLTTTSPTSATYKLWHWNVAGHTLHRGSTTSGLVAYAVSSISDSEAQLISFNELCFGQYQAIAARLIATGWPQDVSNFSRFAASVEPTSGICDGNEEFGNALFSVAPLGTSVRIPLPEDATNERRNLLCATLAAVPTIRFCTTHLTTSEARSAAQLNAVLGQLESWHNNGESVLLAGDFNVQPNDVSLNNWYSPSVDTANNSDNQGLYRELDDQDRLSCPGYGEATTVGAIGAGNPCETTRNSVKLDMVFVRENRISGSYHVDALPIATSCRGTSATPNYPAGSCSDHRIMVGEVTVLQ